MRFISMCGCAASWWAGATDSAFEKRACAGGCGGCASGFAWPRCSERWRSPTRWCATWRPRPARALRRHWCSARLSDWRGGRGGGSAPASSVSGSFRSPSRGRRSYVDPMKEAVLRLAHSDAFHLRPASKFVRVTGRFRSKIWVERDGIEVDGKSILGLLLLAPLETLEVHVRAEGIDESEALEAIEHYFNEDQQQFEENG